MIMPLLQARQMARGKCAALDRRIIRSVQGDATCRRLMTMPGIGPITAVAYVAALEKPDTFKRSRAVGAWLGLTPRRFQSGEVTMTATSRDVVIASCALCFTKRQLYS